MIMIDSHRFFTKNMNSGFEGFKGELTVQECRQGYGYGINICLGKHFVAICEEINAVKIKR
jgi:hypothetical protein